MIHDMYSQSNDGMKEERRTDDPGSVMMKSRTAGSQNLQKSDITVIKKCNRKDIKILRFPLTNAPQVSKRSLLLTKQQT